jgi:DNA-binding MarR family transcriptional regulator
MHTSRLVQMPESTESVKNQQSRTSPESTSGGFPVDLIRDLLGSARLFARSVREVVERELLSELTANAVTFPQLKMLFLVAHSEALAIGTAATFLGISKAAASKTVEHLVRRGLLQRREALGNRRTRSLFLTEAGRQLLRDYEVARDRTVSGIFGHLSSKEVQLVAETLDRLAATIASHSKTFQRPCLPCEVYFREKCRFQELCDCNCYYRHHHSNQQQDSSSVTSEKGPTD